jgi:hypothetical protein
MLLVQRDGTSRAMPIDSADHATLLSAAKEHVATTATIVTDEWVGYRGIG